MRLWRWFVGQVARLRRSVAGVIEPASPALHTDDHLALDGDAPGPPAHWLERVRNGAPGLLEPSLRRRGGPVERPPTNRIAPSQPELAAEPESLEEPERGYVRTEPTVAPQRPEAPVRARRLLQFLRRTLSWSPPARAENGGAPEADTNHAPPNVEAETRRVSEPGEPSPAEPEPRRFVAKSRETLAPPRPPAVEPEQGPPEPEKPERFPEPELPTPGKTVRFQAPPEPDGPEPSKPLKPEGFPERSEVVLFEAPVQRRAAPAEPTASPAPPLETARPSTRSVARAELVIDEVDLFLEQADPVPSPAPIRGAERLPRRLVAPRISPREPFVSRRPAEPLSEAGVHHPWPELPPPLDQPDSDVEGALRAWEHQRRLDHEQT